MKLKPENRTNIFVFLCINKACGSYFIKFGNMPCVSDVQYSVERYQPAEFKIIDF